MSSAVKRRKARKYKTQCYGDGFQTAVGDAGGKSQGATLAVRTQQEVADIMGISRMRVSQIERTALAKLRKVLLCA